LKTDIRCVRHRLLGVLDIFGGRWRQYHPCYKFVPLVALKTKERKR